VPTHRIVIVTAIASLSSAAASSAATWPIQHKKTLAAVKRLIPRGLEAPPEGGSTN
jgi:hypothetical protein